MPNIDSAATLIPPHTMSADARRAELASILAAGLLRLRERNAAATVVLAKLPEGSVHELTTHSYLGR
jgi:hypothetical protein